MAAKNQTKTKGKPATKGAIINALAEQTGLKRAQITTLFAELSNLIISDLGQKGPGVFSLPGLVKFKIVHKPATPEKQGINPFTKQPMLIKAKPARKVVKVTAFKALKDSVAK
jgi:nucleoid DNA-binding protein